LRWFWRWRRASDGVAVMTGPAVDLVAMGIFGLLATVSVARSEWLGTCVWGGLTLLIADKLTGVL
jgi:hypothetical protein